MALQVSAGYKSDVLAAMEGNEELEEGEAYEASDPNYGADLSFPHLELKLTEVLGHVRKDFEGGYYADKLGSKFGGYGTFLPTRPQPLPAAPGRRLSPCTPCRQLPPPGNVNSEVVAKQATAADAADRQLSPCLKLSVLDSASANESKPSSITLRIKMGTEGRGKNAAIYSRLGFSPPSASDNDDDDLSGPESSPDRSPASMIQMILSRQRPPEGLLSPLLDLTLRTAGKPAKVSDNGSAKRDISKERRQSKLRADDDMLEDSGKKDVDADRRQVKQDGTKEKAVRAKGQDEGWKSISLAAKTDEQLMMPLKEICDYTAADDGKVSARKDSYSSLEKTQTAAKVRREELSAVEMPVETLGMDKRKTPKDSESEKRGIKRPKLTGAEISASKEEKKSRAEVKPPKLREDKKKDRFAKLQPNSDPSEALRKDLKDVPKEDSKLKGGKLKASKRSKDAGEPVANSKVFEPPVEPPPDPLRAPAIIINENWVQCENCKTWRLLPPSLDPPKEDDIWMCKMITWLPPGMNKCSLTEEETTAAVYASIGLPKPFVQADPPASNPLLAPAAEQEKTSFYTRKVPRSDFAEELAPKSADIKPSKHTSKRKEKSKKHGLEADDFRATKDQRSVEDKPKKKKRALSEEVRVLKKMKADEGSSFQRGRYPHEEVPSEEDTESHEKFAGKKPVSRQDDGKSHRKERLEEQPRKDKRYEDGDGSQRVRPDETEDSKAMKHSKPDKSTRGKAVRVVDKHTDIQGKVQVSSRLSNDILETRKKKGSENGSPSYDSGRPLDCGTDGGAASEKETRKRNVGGPEHPEHPKLLLEWDEYNEQNSWDEDKKPPVQQRDQQRDAFIDRCRHGDDILDRERNLDSGKWDRRVSNGKEERNLKKGARSSEDRKPDECKPKVRMKHVEAVKTEQEEQKYEKAVESFTERGDRRPGKEVLTTNASDDPSKRLVVPEILDGRHDAKELANSAIKAAKNLKHHADRLKDETAKDIYLQAALKFLQGAALLESVSLYSDTASLFKYCATQYERANDMAGAVLACKCAAVARFRMLLLNNASMSKDRTELQAALHRATPPQIGESPSSSSASDIDNCQMVPVDKMFPGGGKLAVSPLVQAGNLPTGTLARFIRSTAEVCEAFETWSKGDAILAALISAKVLSPEKLAAVEKVGSIGFSDVEALVRLVNQALEALGR